MALHKALRTDMASLAATLQALGRGKDTVLAHITPKEAALLKARGGRGSRNPATGLLEFDDFGVPETVTVSAPSLPAPDFTPTLSVPSQPRQQPAAPLAAPPASTPAPQPANVAPENVTVTGQNQPGPAIVPTPQLTPLAAPTVAAPGVASTVAGPATVPAANAAPENVTVQGTNAPPAVGPILTPGGGAAPSAPAPASSTNRDVKNWLSNNATLLSILGLGGLGFLGARNAGAAGQQAGALQSNIAALGVPLQAAGNNALSATLSGGLTPQNMQVLQATRAQLGQQGAAGAVSAQQAAEAISTTYANLLNTQLNQAITLLNSADQYLQTAYIDGYNANVANQTETTNFYTNLAQLAAKVLG